RQDLGHNQSTGRFLDRRRFLALSGCGAVTLGGFLLVGCTGSSQSSAPNTLQEPPTEKPFDAETQTPTDEEQLNRKVNEMLDAMSLEQKVAQLFIVRPESIFGADPVIQAGEQTREALKQRPVGGIIYFGQNLIDTAQTTTMLANTRKYGLEANGIPPFLCVDEEGGTVSRIGGNAGFGIANVGDMANVGSGNSPELAKSIAVKIAEYLTPLGFNVDFAPVCDVANNPYSDVMRERSFGDNPDTVARMAQAQVEGFLESGMLCSAKHFPGIGAAVNDSHEAMITSNQTIEALHEAELAPFKAAIEARVPFVMVGHLSLPAITGSDIPASLSSEVVQKLLREDLGYEGLIITDSLGMGAIYEFYNDDEVAVRALAAGCDIALMPADFDAAFQGVLDALETDILNEERLNASVRRVLRTKLKMLEF
ncbi:MAG: glycoside hydrolase family 3 protein, partial [Coriobacteriaceae bacterium]|nr:glycoside hydrolase family 3 protein [Coriobacteriaceae bacterium]